MIEGACSICSITVSTLCVLGFVTFFFDFRKSFFLIDFLMFLDEIFLANLLIDPFILDFDVVPASLAFGTFSLFFFDARRLRYFILNDFSGVSKAA